MIRHGAATDVQPGRWMMLLAPVAVAAVLVAVAWFLELWLVVVGSAAAATTLVVAERRRERALARVASALASQTPAGVGRDHEAVTAACLAAFALADVRILDAGRRRIDERVVDPWLRLVAATRLTAAVDLLEPGRRPATAGEDNVVWTSPFAAVSAFSVAVATVALGAVTGEEAMLVPCTAILAVAALLMHEYRLRREIPQILPELATGGVSMPLSQPEDVIIGGLASLADGRRSVLRAAAARLERSSQEHATVARRRLTAAKELAPTRKRGLVRYIGAWAVSTVTAIVLVEWLA